jgi:hypothetical protein
MRVWCWCMCVWGKVGALSQGRFWGLGGASSMPVSSGMELAPLRSFFVGNVLGEGVPHARHEQVRVCAWMGVWGDSLLAGGSVCIDASGVSATTHVIRQTMHHHTRSPLSHSGTQISAYNPVSSLTLFVSPPPPPRSLREEMYKAYISRVTSVQCLSLCLPLTPCFSLFITLPPLPPGHCVRRCTRPTSAGPHRVTWTTHPSSTR